MAVNRVGFSHKIKPWKLERFIFTVTVIQTGKEISSRATERINTGFLEDREKRSETQNSHQACPRKIFQKAVAAVKLKHAATEGEHSVNWHDNYYVKGKGKFYMWICLVNRFTVVVTWDGCSVPKLQSALTQDRGFPQRKCCVIRKKDVAFVRFWTIFAVFVIPDCKLWDKQTMLLWWGRFWRPHNMLNGWFSFWKLASLR